MKRPNNWNDVKAADERVKLPAGGYEAKIISAKVVVYPGRDGDFERLEIAVDITAGEYKDYYKNDYVNNPREDKKWRGVARFYVPTDDGSEKDEFTKRRFRSMTDAVEDSNSNYHWDWDESTLKGLRVGILVRDKEYNFDGKHGFSPEIFKFIGLDKIKAGKFENPKPKYLDGSNQSMAQTTGNAASTEDNDDWPF